MCFLNMCKNIEAFMFKKKEGVLYLFKKNNIKYMIMISLTFLPLSVSTSIFAINNLF